MTINHHDGVTTEGGTRCPVCGAVAKPALDLDVYVLWSCPQCGCWSSDALNRGAETSFEPSDYFENAAADRDKWLELPRRMGESAARVESILDLGCGNGAWLEFAAQQFPSARLAGVELDEERAAQASTRNPEAVIHTGDALASLEAIDTRFDLITMWDVFEHLTEPTRLLKAVRRLLTPGGMVYIQTIHEDSVLPRLGRMSYTLTGGRLKYPARRTHEAHHLVFFSRRGLDSAAASADLEIHRVWFDRLAHDRMDGAPAVTWLTSALLQAENALGNGLFINLLLRAPENE